MPPTLGSRATYLVAGGNWGKTHDTDSCQDTGAEAGGKDDKILLTKLRACTFHAIGHERSFLSRASKPNGCLIYLTIISLVFILVNIMLMIAYI